MLNLVAMVLVVVLIFLGVKYGLSVYTHHGQGIAVPQLVGKSYSSARLLIEEQGLRIEVSDSGYNKQKPADCILNQTPDTGTMVKEGHTIYVIVNSPQSPSFTIPDIVDNSSRREAEARLMAMGFKLTPPRMVVGDRDWVYGLVCRGRRVSSGDRVPIDYPLTLLIGSGSYDDSDDYDYEEPVYDDSDSAEPALPDHAVTPAAGGAVEDYAE